MKQFFKLFIFLSFVFVFSSANHDMKNILNYCSTHFYLTEHGQNSSISLALSSTNSKTFYSEKNPCKIHLIAPSTHLLYIRIVDNKSEFSKIQNGLVIEDTSEKNSKNIEDNEEKFQKQLEDFVNGKTASQKTEVTMKNARSCRLNVFQPEISEVPSYSVDPCIDLVTSEGGLVSNMADLTFTPGSEDTQKWVLITAVGAGEVCLNQKQHSCLQADWTPLLCISKDLLCNGVINCPTEGILGDENPQFCKDRKSATATNWERIANDFLRKFGGKNKNGGSLIPAIQKGQNRLLNSFETTPSPNATNVNSPNTLSQYGPWGYLMLGMLICGTVLTFCGLWECCCKRNKHPQPSNGGIATPSGVSITSGNVASTAVLVLSSGPPKYEELDQPPSYNVLFPEKEEV